MIRNKKTAKHQPQRSQKSHKSNQSELTFLEHLHELRSRVLWVVLSLIVASAVGFQFKDALIDVVMAPLNGEKLVYLTPGGGFSFIFTLSIYFGALLTIPVAVYHLYRFLQPMIKEVSRRFVVTFIVLSALLAMAGTLFGYFIAIPAALDFLTTFAGDTVTPNLTADSYLGFVVAYVLGLAALFQIPLLLFLIDHIRPIPPGGLSGSQRFVIIGSTIAAAVITPTPDVMNMAIIAVPIISVYQIGAFAVFVRRLVRRRKTSAAEVRAKQEEKIRQIGLQRRQALAQALARERQSQSQLQSKTAPVLSVARPVSTARPQPVSMNMVSQKPKVRRTMDGFIVKQNTSPMSAAISRQSVQHTDMTNAPSPQSMRSLDSRSMI